MEYISVKQAAENWNMSERFVQRRCSEGRIEGAVKFGKVWMIPLNSEKPQDRRKSNARSAIDEKVKNTKAEERKHDIMPLMNAIFPLGECKAYIENIKDKAERKIAAAEYNYYTGNVKRCAELSEKYINSDIFELRTSAIWLYALSNISLDKIGNTRKALKAVKEIHNNIDENSNELEQALAICLYNACLTQLHLLKPKDIPKTEHYMHKLPHAFRFFIAYSQAYYAYTNNLHGTAIGMAEICLAIDDIRYPIVSVYLHLICAMCYIHVGYKQLSREHLLKAVKYAKADNLWQPFAELHKELCGMLEAVIKKDNPEIYRKIIKLAKNYSCGWRKIHNEMTGDTIPFDLTPAENTVAMLVARGWTGKEIAAHLNISENAVQKCVGEAMNKMGVTKRADIKKIMLPK